VVLRVPPAAICTESARCRVEKHAMTAWRCFQEEVSKVIETIIAQAIVTFVIWLLSGSPIWL
jgi:hypothetical protein